MSDYRKKLLFVCYGLGIGGIEKCLVNLLNVLPMSRYQVDVLLMNPEYNSQDQVKTEVNYLDSFRYVMNTTDTMRAIAEHGGIARNLFKTISYCCFRLKVKLRLKSWSSFRKLPEHYDIAVAYSQNDYSPYYVIDKVDADRKILWYHNGAYEASPRKYERDKIYYLRFDYVVSVSSDCQRMLQSKFQFAANQCIVLRNICDAESVRKKSEEFIPDSYVDGHIHITTVGRMTSEKGADLALEVCKVLCGKYNNICWHWIGDGNQRENIKSKIREYGLQDNFILEGNQINPYPYMRHSDIYVQPSYYEAYSTTITEAKVLCRPIVTTDVGGMRDQLTDRETGLIVPVERDSLANAISELINSEDYRKQLTHALERNPVNTDTSLQEYIETVFR